MTALLANWRFGAYGLAVAGLLILGWTANGWRLKAQERDKLQAAYEAQIERTKVAEDARVRLSAQLSDMEGQTRLEIREIIKRVPVVVNNGPECALGVDAVRLLNRARGYDVPGTAGGATSPAPAPSATP